MKSLLVYDSIYGNTEKIARAIAGSISGEVKLVRISEVSLSDLQAVDLLAIGSPTQGGRPTQPIQDFLNTNLSSFKGLKIAAFDTRLSTRWVGMFGYAAEKIAEAVKTNGGNLVLPPEGFFVKGREGPLKDGELERAAAWAKGIIK